jgi:zinc/manganese transport system permease protein
MLDAILAAAPHAAAAITSAAQDTGADWWSQLFDFSDYGALLALVRNSILAGAILGLVGGLIGVFVMSRDMAFAVHGISELSFAGASAGLLFGVGVVQGSLIGSIIAALLIGILGSRARDRNSITAVLMPFGLGIGILCLALYPGRSANKFGLLTGQIVAVDDPQLGALLVISVIVVLGLLVVWRPLMFASVDVDVASARGVPVNALSIVFMLLLGLAVAVSVQIVGALLVLSILVTPAAAALRISASPFMVPLLSVVFAAVSMVGGIMLAIGGNGIPISPYVTTISFLIYLVCRVIAALRLRRGIGGRRKAAVAQAA